MKKTETRTITLKDSNNNDVTICMYVTKTNLYTTHHAVTLDDAVHGRYKWQNRPWGNSDRNALRDFAYKYSSTGYGTKDDTDAFIKQIDAIEKRESDEANAWIENFQKDYASLSDTTKKHLANACPEITSAEQADAIMKTSKIFDAMFKMMDSKLVHRKGVFICY